MEWNGNHSHRPYVSRPDNSFGFLYNYNYDHYPEIEIEMKQHGMMSERLTETETETEREDGVVSAAIEMKNNFANQLLQQQQQERKKRLTSDQLDSLESSFQEEIKLDPDRKMKLAHELGLQPRQVAVWFQNRRARWKNKQLERLYDNLKHQFDLVSREKQKLQEEVLALRTIVKEQATMKQPLTDYSELSVEESMKSTLVAAVGSSNNNPPLPKLISHNQIADSNYAFNANGCNHPVMLSPTYWGVLPPPHYPALN